MLRRRRERELVRREDAVRRKDADPRGIGLEEGPIGGDGQGDGGGETGGGRVAVDVGEGRSGAGAFGKLGNQRVDDCEGGLGGGEEEGGELGEEVGRGGEESGDGHEGSSGAGVDFVDGGEQRTDATIEEERCMSDTSLQAVGEGVWQTEGTHETLQEVSLSLALSPDETSSLRADPSFADPRTMAHTDRASAERSSTSSSSSGVSCRRNAASNRASTVARVDGRSRLASSGRAGR